MPLNLEQYSTTALPAEMLLDEDHPSSDPYLKSVDRIQRRVMAQIAIMTRKHVDIVRLAHRGMSNDHIAERVGRQSIGTVLRRPDAKRLLALLRHHEMAIAGPALAQRTAMLWRIARAEEKINPRTAISAVAELNKQDMALTAAEGPAKATQTIIHINQTVLPRGALDEEVVSEQ